MTFSLINAVFLVLAAAVLVAARRRRGRPRAAPVLLAVLVLTVLTAVFDNVMIAADLFAYDDDRRLGVLLGRAPIEDFAYPLGAALLLPALWHLLRRREERR